MTTEQNNLSNKPMLNPFVFPAETKIRFLMLIVAALALSCQTGVIYTTLTLEFTDLQLMQQAFFRTAEVLEGDDIRDVPPDEGAQLGSELSVIQRQAFISGIPRLLLPILFPLGLIVGATIIYLIHPIRIRYHKGAQIIKEDDYEKAPKVFEYIHDCAHLAGLPTLPNIQIKPNSINFLNALSFGVHKRGTLLLYGSLKSLAKAWNETTKDSFYAIILHEFGHIVNHDAQRRQYASAIWVIFVILIIAPLAIISFILLILTLLQSRNLVWTDLWFSIDNSLLLIAQIGFMLAVVKIIWAGAVRVHEYYADWRVAYWGLKKPLIKTLNLGQKNPSKWWEKLGRDLWQNHPHKQQRQKMLEDPTGLFMVSFDLPFLTGLLLAIVLTGMTLPTMVYAFTVTQMTEITNWFLVDLAVLLPVPLKDMDFTVILYTLRLIVPSLAILSVFLIPAYLVSGILGVQIQRETVAELSLGSYGFMSYMRLWRPAGWLAVGFGLGLFIIPVGLYFPQTQLAWLVTPILLIVFTILTWLWLVYVRLFTRVTIGTQTGNSLPKWARFQVTVASILSLWFLYLPVFPAWVTVQLANITIPASFLPDGINSIEFFVYSFVMTTFMLLLLGLFCYILVAALSLSIKYICLIIQKPRLCSHCQQIHTPQRIVIGQTCSICNENLTSWLYANPQSPKITYHS